MMISTRRFCAFPEAVVLGATGRVLPCSKLGKLQVVVGRAVRIGVPLNQDAPPRNAGQGLGDLGQPRAHRRLDFRLVHVEVDVAGQRDDQSPSLLADLGELREGLPELFLRLLLLAAGRFDFGCAGRGGSALFLESVPLLLRRLLCFLRRLARRLQLRLQLLQVRRDPLPIRLASL